MFRWMQTASSVSSGRRSGKKSRPSQRRESAPGASRIGACCEPLESRRLLTTVSMSLNNPLVTEGSGSGTFTISRDNTTGSLAVYYRVGGSAPSSQFSTTFSGSATIASGATSVTVVATPVDDHVADPNRTLTLALTTPEGCGYSLGTTKQATMLVQDADGGQSTYHDLYVGPGQTYATVAAAMSHVADGYYIDVLSSGTYASDTATITHNNITIRGVGNGLASMVWNTSTNLPNGKGILLFNAGVSNLTVENMDLEGARVASGANGAGIRDQGTGLTVTNCRFYNNQDGLLSSDPGNIVIQNSEFTNNGVDTQSHNVYIGTAASLTFQYNYSHDVGVPGAGTAAQGHLLKSRAAINKILYNTFDDGSTYASYEASFPNGGKDTLIGNTIIQRSTTSNSAIIDYGSEVAPLATDFFYLVNNTVVNYRSAGIFVHCSLLPANFDLTSEDNIYAGPGTNYSLSGSTTTVKTNAGNYVNTTVANCGFVSYTTNDYHLLSTSGAINHGVTVGTDPNGFSLTPVNEYLYFCASNTRPASSYLDSGAFGLT